MTSQDKFIALTRKGEDTRIEYKTCTEEISESLYESVCSLLNHSGSQFIFSITYQEVNVQDGDKNVPENVTKIEKMSPTEPQNVPNTGQMSPTDVPELTDEELSIKPFEREIVISKRKRRQQAIVGMISIDSHVSVEAMADKLDVDKKTIKRDLKVLKDNHVIERIGGTFGGEWRIIKKKK